MAEDVQVEFSQCELYLLDEENPTAVFGAFEEVCTEMQAAKEHGAFAVYVAVLENGPARIAVDPDSVIAIIELVGDLQPHEELPAGGRVSPSSST